MELPNRFEREWLTAFGTAAIFITWSTASARCALGATQDLPRALTAQRRSLGRDTRFARIWWVSSPAVALELTRAITLAPEATVKEAETAIRKARQLRIPLAEHDATLERARGAIARLDRGLEVAKQRGVLQEFNWRFKFLRQKQPDLSYGTAHAKLKAEIAKRIAESGKNGLPDLTGIVDAVLPIK